MKIRLEVNERGEWQADVWPAPGEDHHAVGKNPWDALIELGMFWKGQPRSRDAELEQLARLVLARAESAAVLNRPQGPEEK